jgi:opacity protein-like surface antigen
MKKLSVVVLVIVTLTFAGFAEAAKPKKRTRNANRVGPYGAMLLGQARYLEDQSALEQDLIDFFSNRSDPTRDISASSKTEDIGFQLTFGYRFHRYFGAELGLVQLGELSSSVRGEVDQGGGFVPLNLKYTFNVGGPMISFVGILPLGEKAEFYARAGYLFASSEREISARLDGQNAGSNAARGDSQVPVLGVGFAYHFNQVYSLRAEYQKLDDVGQEARTGTEDLNIIGLGFVVRF